ncbi:MAG: NAD-dependent epimerase/dehydratase [Candidatus Saccharibacteria bacterium GW2011_GWA2_46_10]|nr:MAG: NAD-dependent epimerase/dehydratase [Candidatus Saccharibacteria bacterium GW2011_GWA2_46_10]OGL36392.1 MAG: hypothetical protein A3F05_01435 [Candidatus Saccharibacteria bacterium RIFCSPHIGHO2_12_FULL_47_17]
MSSVLISGINGFVGHHLAKALSDQGFRIIGTGMQPKPTAAIADLIDQYINCNMTDAAAVSRLPFEAVDVIFSLAGLAKVGDSFAERQKYMAVNVNVLAVVCERLLKQKLPTKVIAVSTGAVYDPNQPLPFTEDSKLIKDGSPYAVSKVMMEASARRYIEQGLNCLIVRPFNHIGPGQEAGFLLPDLYAKIMAASRGDGVVSVGDLSTARDYTDVRDVVRAYSGLIEAETSAGSIYNICSGQPIGGQVILDKLLQKTGLSGKLQIKYDQGLARQNDPKLIYGSAAKLQQATGWQPQITLDKTLDDFIGA